MNQPKVKETAAINSCMYCSREIFETIACVSRPLFQACKVLFGHVKQKLEKVPVLAACQHL